jgi:glycosyltransferase involved in cell wall biosynthesis
LFSALPDITFRLESPSFHQALWEVLEAQRYDVIQIEGLEMVPYLPFARSVADHSAIIYSARNAEMALQRSVFQAELHQPPRWPAALYAFTQWSKLGGYERLMISEADAVLCGSEEEARKLHGRRVDPQIVPNAVDTRLVPYRPPSGHGARILFVGAMHHRPDADGVQWFVSQALPAIRRAIPEARLRLIGPGAERVQAEGVESVGHVQNAYHEMAQSDVLVVPRRMGGGPGLSVLEAMAAGVPVVSTSAGIAGIAVEHERHALVSDRAEDFAVATIRVLGDRDLARQMAEEARRLVQTRYDWGKIAPLYLRLLTAARRKARR